MKYIESNNSRLEIGSIEESSFNEVLGTKYKSSKKVIIVDENTHISCLEYLITTFEQLKDAEVIVLPAGEMNKELGEHFICRTRHLKCSTIFLMHTLFQNKDIHRLISNNTHYFVIFGNRRQMQNVKTLGNQLGMSKQVLEGYKYARAKPFGYFVIALHPRVVEELTVTSDWFEQWPSVFH